LIIVLNFLKGPCYCTEMRSDAVTAAGAAARAKRLNIDFFITVQD
jgi:hypothetical protein